MNFGLLAAIGPVLRQFFLASRLELRRQDPSPKNYAKIVDANCPNVGEVDPTALNEGRTIRVAQLLGTPGLVAA
jgi:hypothetical protein